jgi:hypothetical protein
MDEWDLHIACAYRPTEPDRRCVVIALQPSDALMTENKVGTALPEWADVMEIIAGLIETGTQAWGTMPANVRHEHLLILLGELAGALTLGPHRERLTQQVREGKLKAGYVTLLRDQLSRVLRDSGVEPEEGRGAGH